MRTGLAATVLASCVASSSAFACMHSDPVEIGAVSFVKHDPIDAVKQIHVHKGPPLGAFTVTIDFTPGGGYERNFVLIASMDMIIAPRDLPPGMLPKNLETEVSWGALATEENLRSVVLDHVRSCETTNVKTFEFSLDDMVDRHFSGEDELWPWVIRVKAVVVDRNGSVVARGKGALRNEWRPASPVGESPNKSLVRTRAR